MFLHHQLLFYICLQFFYNNLTACHKELQVFLELMDNRRAMHVIHQNIEDQLIRHIELIGHIELIENVLLDSFH